MPALCVLATVAAVSLGPPLALAAAPEPASTPSAPARAGPLGQGSVRLSPPRTLPSADLLAAIGLRIPHATWSIFGTTTPTPSADTLTAVVDVVAAGPEAYAVTIVVSDGRAFDRHVDAEFADTTERTRLLATTIANLIAGIEAGTLAPDRSDVPLPIARQCPERPVCPVAPPVSSAVASDPTPPVAAPAAHLAPPAPKLPQLGVALGVPVVLGLGSPADADRFAAWGGDIGLRARLTNGLTLAVGARPNGRATVGDVRIIRGRIAAGAGYTLRRGALEASGLFLATVEPWLVRLQGSAGDFVDGPSETRLILGGAAHLAAGLNVRSPSRPVSVRVGPYLQLGVSGSPGDGFAVPRIVLPGEDASRLRLGGAELSLGLSIVTWIDLARRR